MKPHGEMIKLKNGNMHIRRMGTGKKTIVLLPGWNTPLPTVMFAPLMKELSKKYIVCTIELFGYGHSDSSNAPRTNENYVEEIRETLTKAEIKSPYVLMPYSASGVYAEYYAAKYPDEIDGLILLDSTPTVTAIAQMFADKKTESPVKSDVEKYAQNGYTKEELAEIGATPNHHDTLIAQDIALSKNIFEVMDMQISKNIPVLILRAGLSGLNNDKQIEYEKNLHEHIHRFGEQAKLVFIENSKHNDIYYNSDYRKLISREVDDFFLHTKTKSKPSNKKVIVIDPRKILHKKTKYSLDSLILYEELSSLYGWDAEVFDTTKDALNERINIVEEIINSKPCVVCITTQNDTYPFCLDMVDKIKKRYKDIKVVLVGAHATLTHEATLDFSKNVDVILRGAIEKTIKQVMLSEFCYDRLGTIPNISFYSPIEDKAFINDASKDNNEIRTPVDSLLRYNLPPGTKRAIIEVGRGCSFNCSFCKYNKVYNNSYSIKEPLSVINDIESILEVCETIERFDFRHDNLLINRVEAENFIDVINKKLPKHIFWNCSTRVDLLDEAIIKKLKSANCYAVYLGIETGSKILQKIYNKNIDLDHAVDNLILLSKNGVKFVVSFIIGHPAETKDDILETLLLALFAQSLDSCITVQIRRLAVFYGTDIYENYSKDLFFDPERIPEQSTDLINEDDKRLIICGKELFSSFYTLKTEEDIHEIGYKAPLFQLIIRSFPDTLQILKSDLGADLIKTILLDMTHSIEDFVDIVESYAGRISRQYDSCVRKETKAFASTKQT